MNTDWDKSRIRQDLKNLELGKFYAHWEGRNTHYIDHELLRSHSETWLDLGAGSGDFFMALAFQRPNTRLIAVERSRLRAKTLLKRTQRIQALGLNNFSSFRGNIIPALVHGLPPRCLDKIFILYPCPWPKNSHRKHRWHLSPVFPKILEALKPLGQIIWASDQKFYIEEAYNSCVEFYSMKPLYLGKIHPNLWNELEHFPSGRTKFESHFLSKGQPCYELVVEKTV